MQKHWATAAVWKTLVVKVIEAAAKNIASHACWWRFAGYRNQQRHSVPRSTTKSASQSRGAHLNAWAAKTILPGPTHLTCQPIVQTLYKQHYCYVALQSCYKNSGEIKLFFAEMLVWQQIQHIQPLALQVKTICKCFQDLDGPVYATLLSLKRCQTSCAQKDRCSDWPSWLIWQLRRPLPCPGFLRSQRNRALLYDNLWRWCVVALYMVALTSKWKTLGLT